jgi:hypothetical protein
MKPLLGTYAGTVESIDDPEQRGRVKARVVQVYGPTSGAVGTEDLPWALPAGLPAGGSSESGGLNWLPNKGDQVFIRFLDGEPEKPVWEWALQTATQKKRFPFRRYDGQKPRQEILLTRFGHAFELAKSTAILTTRSGYSLLLQDTSGGVLDGLFELRSARGAYVRMEDGSNTLFTFVDQVMENYSDMLHQGLTAEFIMRGLFAADGGQLAQLTATKVQLGSKSASDPVVRLSDLKAVVTRIVTWANAHYHPKGKPPVLRLQVTPSASKTTFTA